LSVFDPGLERKAAALVELCQARTIMVATAESCTGGLVAGLLTEIAGSSAVLDCGFVTYSNGAKAELLGVPWDVLDSYGAVSRQTAEAMATGALSRSRAQATVAITGIAGPGGGSDAKPVGLVHFAAATTSGVIHVERRFGAIGREQVRLASVDQALSLLERCIRAN
jgi:nicotinamide-nucleotide amidase